MRLDRAATGGGAPHKLTTRPNAPRWSPDGKRIYLYRNIRRIFTDLEHQSDGTDPRQITQLSTEADGEIVSPDGKYLVVTSDVYPDCGADDACNQRKIDEAKQSKTQAHIATSLLYRHWDTWQGEPAAICFPISLDDGKAVDLSPGNRVTPPFSLGGPDDYAISPDSAEVCLLAERRPQSRPPARTTKSSSSPSAEARHQDLHQSRRR